MNILHTVNENEITPEHFLACIEIPAGSSCKYEMDEHSGALKLDRILYTATHYPQNYGFIPKTWGLDDDPLDVLVITSCPVVPLALVRAYPIGILSMIDSGKVDETIIAICQDDPFYNEFKDIKFDYRRKRSSFRGFWQSVLVACQTCERFTNRYPPSKGTDNG